MIDHHIPQYHCSVLPYYTPRHTGRLVEPSSSKGTPEIRQRRGYYLTQFPGNKKYCLELDLKKQESSLQRYVSKLSSCYYTFLIVRVKLFVILCYEIGFNQ